MASSYYVDCFRDDISTESYLHLRYEGTDCALMCCTGSEFPAMSETSKYGDFEKAFLQRLVRASIDRCHNFIDTEFLSFFLSFCYHFTFSKPGIVDVIINIIIIISNIKILRFIEFIFLCGPKFVILLET